MIDQMRAILGPIRVVETCEPFPGGIRLGGYAIHYDMNGNEVGRTENEWNVIVRLGPDPQPTFWQRLRVVASVVLRWP